MIRLDKFLSDAGVASRREAKDMLKAGRVTLNGAVCRSGDVKLDPAAALVTVDGREVGFAKNRYFLLHKPLGVITATEDKDQQTVLDILPAELKKLGLFPVGRLDKDTSGLLILTNDGDYAHRVISPKKQVYKVYLAHVDADLEEGDIAKFREGIELADGTKCLPGGLEIISARDCRVTICEGKYHQVRRMLAACGKRVVTLHRQSIGALVLDEKLPHGQVRELTKAEADLVFKAER